MTSNCIGFSKCRIEFIPANQQRDKRDYSERSVVELRQYDFANFSIRALDIENNREEIFAVPLRTGNEYKRAKSSTNPDEVEDVFGTYRLWLNDDSRTNFHEFVNKAIQEVKLSIGESPETLVDSTIDTSTVNRHGNRDSFESSGRDDRNTSRSIYRENENLTKSINRYDRDSPRSSFRDDQDNRNQDQYRSGSREDRDQYRSGNREDGDQYKSGNREDRDQYKSGNREDRDQYRSANRDTRDSYSSSYRADQDRDQHRSANRDTRDSYSLSKREDDESFKSIHREDRDSTRSNKRDDRALSKSSARDNEDSYYTTRSRIRDQQTSSKSKGQLNKNNILVDVYQLGQYISRGQTNDAVDLAKKLCEERLRLDVNLSDSIVEEKPIRIRIKIDSNSSTISNKYDEQKIDVYPSTTIAQLRAAFEYTENFSPVNQYFFVNGHLAHEKSTMNDLDVNDDILFILFLIE